MFLNSCATSPQSIDCIKNDNATPTAKPNKAPTGPADAPNAALLVAKLHPIAAPPNPPISIPKKSISIASLFLLITTSFIALTSNERVTPTVKPINAPVTPPNFAPIPAPINPDAIYDIILL